MTFNTVLDLKIDLGDSRPCFRHPCAPTHHPGPFEHIKFRIFIIALPRSSKSRFFGKLKLKMTGVVTNPFQWKKFWTFPRLIGSQEGLYIYPLWVEESTLQVTHVVRYTVLGVPLNRDSGFKRNHQNSVLEDPKFLNCDWVPINAWKNIKFSPFFVLIDTDEGSLHEKRIFNVIYTDSVLCNDPRYKNWQYDIKYG